VSRCPDKQHCFLGRARRAVAKADILVVNHHMLFSDLSVKMETGDFSTMAVLPAYGRLIFDEAHSIEDSATEYLGVTASQAGANAILGQIQRVERGRERGLVPLLLARVMKDCPQVSIDEFERIQDICMKRLLPALAVAREGFKAAFTAIRELTARQAGQVGRDIKWRLTENELKDRALREIHVEVVVPAVDHVRNLLRHLNALYDRLELIKPTPEQRESPVATELLQLNGYMHRLERMTNALAECTSEELEENTVRWIEIDARNPNVVRVVRCPLEVGKPLAEWLYDNMKTLVMTSATLAVNQDFKFLFSRLGLGLVPQDRLETLILDTPYDFEHQALLGIPRDMPEPSDPAFGEEVVDCLRDMLMATRGHAFVLFTSYSALDRAYQRLAGELEDAGITPLKQGAATRTRLIERFRSDTSSVLFATDSFWEGVDVVGDALQCVRLARLPFRVPTEPVLQARTELIEQRGGNAFAHYSVPQAVIKFRQGFGRLIRSRGDRGVVLVLDRRILTKPYGRQFLKSLPALRVLGVPRPQLLEALTDFFNPKGTPHDHAEHDR
jgi:ATP-dependent DNA helicase DinG